MRAKNYKSKFEFVEVIQEKVWDSFFPDTVYSEQLVTLCSCLLDEKNECIFQWQDKSFLSKTLLAEAAPVKPQKVTTSKHVLLVVHVYAF